MTDFHPLPPSVRSLTGGNAAAGGARARQKRSASSLRNRRLKTWGKRPDGTRRRRLISMLSEPLCEVGGNVRHTLCHRFRIRNAAHPTFKAELRAQLLIEPRLEGWIKNVQNIARGLSDQHFEHLHIVPNIIYVSGFVPTKSDAQKSEIEKELYNSIHLQF